jgi:AcrR family transcriptional regulator
VSTESVRRAWRKMTVDERRQEIVNTASHLFDANGYSSTTMEDIARTLAIAKPTLYHYFASKEEILFWIHEQFIDLIIDRHEKRLLVGLDPNQLLLEVMADILELMETHHGHVRVFFEHHRELPDSQREIIRLKRDHYESMIENVFVIGTESGAFRFVDPKLATLAMFGMCNWAYQWYQTQGSMRTRDIAYVFWGILVRGVAYDHVDAPAIPNVIKSVRKRAAANVVKA